MNTLKIIGITLVAMATLLTAQVPSGMATTGKPNILGEQEKEVSDGPGRVTETAHTSKPNFLGEQNTVICDSTGRVNGI
jgi:hypothetical protein